MLPLIGAVCCFLCWLQPEPLAASEELVDLFAEGFERTGNVIVPGIVAGRRVNCMLDSGATTSVVDLGLARRFPEHLRGPRVKVGTAFRVEEVQSYQSIERSCLDLPVQTGPVNACDLSYLRKDGGIRADAILGMDYCHPLIFCFEAGLPRFVERSKFLPAPAAMAHVLKLKAATHTTANIDLGVLGEREFMIDTGHNGYITILPDWIKRMLTAGDAVLQQEIIADDGSGARSISLYVIREIQVFGITMRNVPAVESELNLIGLALMRHLDISIDFENSVAYVVPSSRSVDSFEIDASGLRTVFQPNIGQTVRHIVPHSPAEKSKILVGDQLLEIDGRIVSGLSYWEIRKLLSQAGKTIPIKVKNGDQVRDIQLPLSRKFEYPPKWKPRSTDAEDFMKSLENESKR